MSKELIERLHDKFGCEWKPVPSLDGKYLVSDTGVIYSVPRRYTKGGVLKTVIAPLGIGAFVCIAKHSWLAKTPWCINS